MITKYNRKSLTFGIPGILLHLGCLVLFVVLGLKDGSHIKPFPEWVATLVLLGMILGAILWLVGMCYYAMAKGHNAALGFLGLFSFFGLLILIALPDKAEGGNHDAAFTAPEK